MAEIEHFCDPDNKDHPKFGTVKDVVLTFYSACNQMDGKAPVKKTIGEAVKEVSEWTNFDEKWNCEKLVDFSSKNVHFKSRKTEVIESIGVFF